MKERNKNHNKKAKAIDVVCDDDLMNLFQIKKQISYHHVKMNEFNLHHSYA